MMLPAITPAGPVLGRAVEDPFSTVLVRSRASETLAAFTAAAHGDVPGTPEWVQRAFGWKPGMGRAETNMQEGGLWAPAEWTGLVWGIPHVLEGSVDVPNSEFRPYEVTIADVLSFARKVKLVLEIDELAVAVVRPFSYPIEWRGLGAYQFARFIRPVVYAGKPSRFRLRLDWPGGAPAFNSRAKDPNSEVLLPVAFRLSSEAADNAEAKQAAEVAQRASAVADDALAKLVGLTSVITEQARADSVAASTALTAAVEKASETLHWRVAEVVEAGKKQTGAALEQVQAVLQAMAKFMPPADVSAVLYAEIRALRESFGGKDEDLIDVLRAVRQGVRTR